jgi:hypothetical protein
MQSFGMVVHIVASGFYNWLNGNIYLLKNSYNYTNVKKQATQTFL